jgi:hypothetical protein
MSIAEEMLENAFEAQKLTRKHFVVELDFSEQSIQDLDRIADDVDFTLSGGKSPENIELLSRAWGSYLGEVLCRTKGGQWIESPDHAFGTAVQCGDSKLDPHGQIRKRLKTAGESLVGFCQSLD